jgi:hypothetical protein
MTQSDISSQQCERSSALSVTVLKNALTALTVSYPDPNRRTHATKTTRACCRPADDQAEAISTDPRGTADPPESGTESGVIQLPRDFVRTTDDSQAVLVESYPLVRQFARVRVIDELKRRSLGFEVCRAALPLDGL